MASPATKGTEIFAAGRTTSIQRASGNTNFTYDYESRVTSITKPGMVTNLMSYNGLDTRVGLTDSAGTKTFQRDGVGVTAPVLSDGTATFTASGENRGGVKTTFNSALKNTDLQTNASGSVTAERQYDAFGNVIASSGAWTSQFGNAGRFGYQEDPESELKLLGHRYYDSSTGRFLTRDPIKDGRNWYSYCENRPVAGVDANGLKPQLAIIIGNTDGVDIDDLVQCLKDTYGENYDIVIVMAYTNQDIEDTLVTSDAAVLIGHGAPFVLRRIPFGRGGGVLNSKTLANVAKRRKALGKSKLDFIRIYSCGVLSTEEERAAFLLIARLVWGFRGLMFFWRNDGASTGKGVVKDGEPAPRWWNSPDWDHQKIGGGGLRI